MPPIIAAPVLVEERKISGKDILYTAWSRGRDGQDWMNDTLPLDETLTKLINEAVADRVSSAVAAIISGNILPPESIPRDGTRIDIWWERWVGSPQRATDCSYSLQSRKTDGTETYGFSTGMSDTYYTIPEDKIVGWAPIPEWQEKADEA